MVFSRLAHLLPGTANGLLPVRRMLCSDWLEEEELEDLASLSGWDRCSSAGFCLFHTTIWGEEVIPFLLRTQQTGQDPHSWRKVCRIYSSSSALTDQPLVLDLQWKFLKFYDLLVPQILESKGLRTTWSCQCTEPTDVISPLFSSRFIHKKYLYLSQTTFLTNLQVDVLTTVSLFFICKCK